MYVPCLALSRRDAVVREASQLGGSETARSDVLQMSLMDVNDKVSTREDSAHAGEVGSGFVYLEIVTTYLPNNGS